MSFFSSKKLLLVLAAVDVAVFGGWISHEETVRQGERVELPIEGYDPRDLLSGHYVEFRLVAAREASELAPDATSNFAVCLERGADGHHHATRLRKQGDACAPYLHIERGGHRRSRWRSDVDLGVDRFYIDERRAAEVGNIQRATDSYLVATTHGGEVHAIDLVILGSSLEASE